MKSLLNSKKSLSLGNCVNFTGAGRSCLLQLRDPLVRGCNGPVFYRAINLLLLMFIFSFCFHFFLCSEKGFG